MPRRKWIQSTKVVQSIGIVAIAMAIASSPAISDELIMPRELADIAETNQCAPVKGFYERPGRIDPPYAYASGTKNGAAVLWCMKDKVDERPYRLLFKTGEISINGTCPDRLDWWDRPRGLSLTIGSDLPLRGFRAIDAPDKSLNLTGDAIGTVIVDSYDGLATYFYCNHGRWLFQTQD